MTEFSDDYVCEGQMSIFDFTRKPFRIQNKIRLIELFGGIGSQAMALRNIGADFEHYRLCEWEQHAVDSYNAIHGTHFQASDIQKMKGEDLGIINTEKYTYIMTYSFPCQDLSVAGNMRGMEKGSGTRSGLLWEVERLLREVENRPQVLVMENVIQVHSEGENRKNFFKWLSFLESMGYSNYWKDMNAKNYGIPQNRNRTIMVSILGEYNYKFPDEVELTVSPYDLLEDDVDDKYYLSGEKCSEMIDELKKNGTILTDRQTDRQTDDLSTLQSTTRRNQTQSTVLKQDTTPESQTDDKKERAYVRVSFFRGNKPFESKLTNIASTVLAGTGKGMSNLGEDIIVEKTTDCDNGL